jgi:adenylylsulfate kinase
MSDNRLVWITGLPSSGKSTLARRLCEELRAAGVACCLLDSDDVRAALAAVLGYDRGSRDKFYETLADLGHLLAEQGLVVVVAATAHRRAYRDRARQNVARFIEVWVDVPLEECRQRDEKGIYAAFAAGRAQDVPGEDTPYEAPSAPDVVAGGGLDRAALGTLVDLVTARG